MLFTFQKKRPTGCAAWLSENICLALHLSQAWQVLLQYLQQSPPEAARRSFRRWTWRGPGDLSLDQACFSQSNQCQPCGTRAQATKEEEKPESPGDSSQTCRPRGEHARTDFGVASGHGSEGDVESGPRIELRAKSSFLGCCLSAYRCFREPVAVPRSLLLSYLQQGGLAPRILGVECRLQSKCARIDKVRSRHLREVPHFSASCSSGRTTQR